MQRQPNPDDPAYRDQSKRKTLDDKKTETPGSKLEREGDYIDTGELDQEGNPQQFNLADSLKSTWEGVKEFRDPRNPMNLGWNIGALGARGVEAVVPQTKEELMFEIATWGQGKKFKLGKKLLTAAVADGYNVIRKWVDGQGWVLQTVDGPQIPWNEAAEYMKLGPLQFAARVANPGAGDIPLSQRVDDAYVKNKKLIKDKQGLPEPVFHGDDILNNFPDDVNTLGTVHDLAGKHTRNEAAGLLTGNTPKDSTTLETMFNQYTERIAETINSTLPKRIRDRLWQLESPGRTARWHHIGPIKQVAASVNGLTDEAAKNGAKYISDGIGRKVGNLWGAGTPLVDEFHKKIHMIFNVGAGKTSTGKLKGYNINQHIEKLGWPDNWQELIPHKDRKDLYDLIIADVVESEAVIDTFWTRLNDLVDSPKVNRKQFLKSFFDTKMLDSRIKQAYNDPDVTTLTDMMQHITGQTNEALSNIVNLLGNTPKRDVMYPVLLKEQGTEALLDVIELSRKLPEGQIVPASTVFSTYNIKLNKSQQAVVNKVVKGFKDDTAYQHMLGSRNKNIPPADSVWNFGQDN